MTLIEDLLTLSKDRQHSQGNYYLFKHEKEYGATNLEFFSMIDVCKVKIMCLYFPIYGGIKRNDEQIISLVETSNYYQWNKLYEQFSVRKAKRLADICHKELKLWLTPNASLCAVLNLSYKLNLGYHLSNFEVDHDILYDPDYTYSYPEDDTSWV